MSENKSFREINDKYWNVAESIFGISEHIDSYKVLSNDSNPEESESLRESADINPKAESTNNSHSSLLYEAFIQIHEMILAEDYDNAINVTKSAMEKHGKIRELVDLQLILQRKSSLQYENKLRKGLPLYPTLHDSVKKENFLQSHSTDLTKSYNGSFCSTNVIEQSFPTTSEASSSLSLPMSSSYDRIEAYNQNDDDEDDDYDVDDDDEDDDDEDNDYDEADENQDEISSLKTIGSIQNNSILKSETFPDEDSSEDIKEKNSIETNIDTEGDDNTEENTSSVSSDTEDDDDSDTSYSDDSGDYEDDDSSDDDDDDDDTEENESDENSSSSDEIFDETSTVNNRSLYTDKVDTITISEIIEPSFLPLNSNTNNTHESAVTSSNNSSRIEQNDDDSKYNKPV